MQRIGLDGGRFPVETPEGEETERKRRSIFPVWHLWQPASSFSISVLVLVCVLVPDECLCMQFCKDSAVKGL